MRHLAAISAGRIELSAAGNRLIAGLSVQLDLTLFGRRQLFTLAAWQPSPTRPQTWISDELAGLSFTLSLHPPTEPAADSGLELGFSLENRSADGLAVHALLLSADAAPDTFLQGLGQTADWRVFLAGYNSFSPAICRDSRERFRWPRFAAAGTFNQYNESVYFGRDEYLSSPWYATFTRLGGPSPTLLLGWLSAQVGLGEIAVRRGARPGIEARLSFDGKQLSPGQTLPCEPLFVGLSQPGQGESLLATYVAAVARHMAARRPIVEAPSGWCSWYYYYTSVADESIRKNLAVLSGERASLPVRYVQLDDGYQSRIGDWLLPNAKFGSSLASLGRLASEVRAAGFVPGIWVAPFIVQRSAQLYAQHPDWILADHEGKKRRIAHHLPWGLTDGQIYPLDLTQPQVLAYLDKVFRALREVGFGYFKIDFLSAGLRNGRRHDPRKSPVEAFRAALSVIRTAVGDDFLLGCGAPLLPAVGLCDGVRVSSDVKEVWRDPKIAFFAADCGHPSAELALWNDLTRAHLHRRWFINDPDCLLVRERDSRLTRPEIETLCSVLSLSGGSLFLSDDMSQLASERRWLAEQTLPVRDNDPDHHAYAPGLLYEKRPSRFLRHRDRDGSPEILAAIINWDDAKSARSVPLSDLDLPPHIAQQHRHYHCYERFSDRYTLLSSDDKLPLSIAAHGCALLLLRPQRLCPKTALPRPQIVGLTHHLSGTLFVLQREAWDPDRLELQLTLELGARRSGELLLHLPADYALRDASADSPARIKIPARSQNQDALHRFSLDIDERTHVRLRFSRI